MTEQYLPKNINEQGGASTFTSSVATPDIDLAGAGNQLVRVDATAAASQVNLPSAAEAGAGATIVVAKSDAGVNAVTVAAQAGEQILVPAGSTNILAAIDEALTVVSDGGTNWQLVSLAV